MALMHLVWAEAVSSPQTTCFCPGSRQTSVHFPQDLRAGVAIFHPLSICHFRIEMVVAVSVPAGAYYALFIDILQLRIADFLFLDGMGGDKEQLTPSTVFARRAQVSKFSMLLAR